MSRKRARMMVSRRPIDKQLIFTALNITSTQASTTLMDSSNACTATGIRWDMHISAAAGTTSASYGWAIVLVPDSVAVSTLNVSTSGSPFYQPEQHVLAFGTWRAIHDADATQNDFHFAGSTKTMRKLKKDDQIRLIALSDSATGSVMDGVVQIFCKE